MKKILKLSSLAVLTFLLTAPASIKAVNYRWYLKNNFLGGIRYSTSYFSIGNYGYVGTGYNGSAHSDWWKYDPNSDTWSQVSNLPGPARWSAICFSINNIGYVISGTNGSYLNDWYEYDPLSNTWTSKGNIPFPARQDAVGLSIGNKGYICCGYSSIYRKDLWEFDQAAQIWTQKQDFPYGRSGAFGFATNNKLYVGCGQDASSAYNDFYCYDPLVNSWNSIASLPGAIRNSGASFTLDNYGFVGIGYDNASTYHLDFYYYNDTSNSWTQIANFPLKRRTYPFVLSIGNKAFVGTGRDNTMAYTNDVAVLYDVSVDIAEVKNKIISKWTQSESVLQLNYSLNDSHGDLSIYDIVGRTYYKCELKSNSGTENIDPTLFAPGTYFYVIETQKGSISGKIAFN